MTSLALLLPGGRGIVWDGEDDAASIGMWVASTHRLCRAAARSPGWLPALAPGTRARQGFGEMAGGVQEAAGGPRGSPQGPARESQEVPWGLAASLAAPQVSAQFPFQNMEQ